MSDALSDGGNASNLGAPIQRITNLLKTVEVDDSWAKLLPEGSVITSKTSHGSSPWAPSARIDVELPSGETRAYFLKLAKGENGLDLVRGEFESMKAFHVLSKEAIPEPIGFGTYVSDDHCHFFLAKFIDMIDEIPNIVDLGKLLAELHLRSIPASPNGKFGFHVTTYNGNVPHECSWTDTWEAFYIKALKHTFALEAALHGPSEEIDKLTVAIYDKVVPRLLRPLETQGRILKACLVHGDFWGGNTAVGMESDQLYLFDSGAFWGHNECRPFMDEYFKHFPVAPPEEDWQDRNLLYSLLWETFNSILFPPPNNFREVMLDIMKQLVEKFPRGYAGLAVNGT